MDADIPFHKVEARVTQETADGVRTDIQTVDIIAVITQQAFGQVVTDKAVNAEDQHAGSAFHHCVWLGGQAHVGDDPHFLRQTAALHVQTDIVLAGHNFQRTFTAGNDQRRGTEHGTRLLVMPGIQHAGTPDNQFTLAKVAESTRVRFGHGTDQVVNFLR
ncbi:hypothetical protein D3C81_1486170 [compost metagenome]